MIPQAKWTVKRFEASLVALEEKLRAEWTSTSGVSASQWLLAEVERQVPDNSEFLLRQFVGLYLALRRNDEENKLAPATVLDLLTTTEKMLRTVGIRESDARLSFLFSDLYRIRARLNARTGNSWAATWHSELAHDITPSRDEATDCQGTLLAAQTYLRLGHASVAAQLFFVAGATALPELQLEANLGRSQALRLMGDLQAAEKVWSAAVAFDSQSQSLIWEKQRLAAQRRGNVIALIAYARGPAAQPVIMLEAKLWAYAAAGKTLAETLPLADSIRRRFHIAAGQSSGFADLLGCVKAIEAAYDTEAPLPLRLRDIGEALAQRQRLPAIEHELLFILAARRALISFGRQAMADLVTAEYIALSLKLSRGLSTDVMGLAPPQQIKPVRTAFVARAASMTGLFARAAGSIAKSRGRWLVANADERRRFREQELSTLGEQLYLTLSQMKGGLMKVGQILSYAAPLDDSLQAPLRLLQTTAQPTSRVDVDGIIADDLGQPPLDVFDEWQPLPSAVGSIGQVHFAKTKSGQNVAVKVQHPGVAQSINSDIKFLGLLTPVFRRLLPAADINGLIDEIGEQLLSETDYQLEKANLNTYATLFKNHPHIVILNVLNEHTNGRVLTMTRLSGVSYAEFLATATSEKKQAAAQTIIEFYVTSLFKYGFFNGDPHPGNYIFLEGDGSRVGFLDFGCVKRWPQSFVDGWRAAILALMDQNLARHEQAWQDLGYISDLNHFDSAKHMRAMTKMHRFLVEDKPFKFTPDFLHEVNRINLQEPTLRKYFTPPKAATMLIRVTWGLLAILTELGAEANWHRLARQALDRAEESRRPSQSA